MGIFLVVGFLSRVLLGFVLLVCRVSFFLLW